MLEFFIRNYQRYWIVSEFLHAASQNIHSKQWKSQLIVYFNRTIYFADEVIFSVINLILLKSFINGRNIIKFFWLSDPYESENHNIKIVFRSSFTTRCLSCDENSSILIRSCVTRVYHGFISNVMPHNKKINVSVNKESLWC